MERDAGCNQEGVECLNRELYPHECVCVLVCAVYGRGCVSDKTRKRRRERYVDRSNDVVVFFSKVNMSEVMLAIVFDYF